MKKRKILEGRGSEKKKKKQKDGKKEKEKNGKKKERKKTTKRVRSADWRAAVPFLAHARQITTPLSNVLKSRYERNDFHINGIKEDRKN